MTTPSQIRSKSGGMIWPPVLTGPAAVVHNLLRDIEEIAWLTPEEIERHQFAQLRSLAAWCMRHSPLFARHMASAGLKAADFTSRDALAKLPFVTRAHLQDGHNGETYCRALPDGHDPVFEGHSSGSTGEPTTTKRTRISTLFWLAHSMREYQWAGTDFTHRASIIRASIDVPTIAPDWGQPASMLCETGPMQLLPLRVDAKEQLAAIAQFQPHTLLVYPSVLAAMTRHVRDANMTFCNLRRIQTVSETLSPRVRTEAESAFGVRVVDNYSSQEVGVIALECPISRHYHVMSDNLLVEILDADGLPCREGEIGRVVVTDLHNFATPLIRYALGDYAEVGPPCPCGRGLPTLARILGKERNLVQLPNGKTHWPLFGNSHFWDHASVRQFQFIQHSLTDIEARLVVDQRPSPDGEAGLRKLILEGLGHPFDLRFVWFEKELPRPPGGKMEEFLCNVKV